MNYIKRALLSVWKHKVKNLLLVIVFAVIATLVLSGLSIQAAAAKEEYAAQLSLGANVTIHYDFNKIQANAKAAAKEDKIPFDPIRSISKSKYVADYNEYGSADGVAVDFKPNVNEEVLKQLEDEFKTMLKGHPLNDLSLIGCLNSSTLDYFTSGGYKLITGRQISKDDAGKPNIMIPKAVADKNNLKTGDSITIQVYGIPDKNISFKIVGVFEAPSPGAANERYVSLNPNDWFFISYTELQAFQKDKQSGIDFATFNLVSPKDIAPFEAASKKYLDTTKFVFDAHNQAYEEMVAPLENVMNLIGFMALAAMLAGALILILLTVLSLRGRNHEFGVLLAVGEKKIKIIGQVFLETLVPIFIAFLLSVAANQVVSQKIGQMLLNNQVNASYHENAVNSLTMSGMLIGNVLITDPHASSVDKISVAVTQGDLGKFAAAGLLLVLLSVLVSSASILRFQPRKILVKKE